MKLVFRKFPNLAGLLDVCDVSEALPAFMLKADLLFIDPPWNIGNLHGYYTKAELTWKFDTHDEFMCVLARRVDEIRPKTFYLEMGRQHVDRSIDIIQETCRFKHVQKWLVTYYRKKPCWIVRFGKEKTSLDFAGMDEADCIEKIALLEDYSVIGDLCIGKGLAAKAAVKAGKPFVGTELNPKRLAVLLGWLERKGYEVF